ncbi:ABC transporter ATP-binding protein [Companilactobacillus zhachilii]|uniref:ABC transporter ATP-binding protein n=1 Tax=Companilactobacillus zhachilii TaxID=2304606 RepID=UPI0019217B39|nr:ABC transporter ATP-binding protein [Companilactobacillus zhachilii]MBL3531512.1 ABC transporter ATP-binding protein [Companilactobacillus zhachilii]
MVNTIISMKNVVKKFGKETVLNHIDFDISQGKIIGLIGPSGAGKSTIIKIILGMEKTQEGSATVFGKIMPNRQLLNRIGYMAQTDALYEALTAKENLQFYADMKGIAGQKANRQILHVAEVVELTNYLNKRVSGYSGGMKRRLSLAIAMLGDSEVLILDEPTVGIDPALRRQVWSELHKLRDQGKTILVTTHVMDEAELVDDVALILGGQLIAYDTPANLKDQYNEVTVENVFLKVEYENEKNLVYR